jgi:hypothetical protein
MIFPQVGISSAGIPSPKKLKIASTIIADATMNVP